MGFERSLRRAATCGLAAVACVGGGCLGAGRIEQSGAELIDLVARQTAAALDEYERDMLGIDAGRREAAVQALAERVKRDGSPQIDAHAAALLKALDRIAADRLTARQRYEAAMDNVDVLREVAAGLRRFGERVRQWNDSLRPVLGSQP